MTDQKEPTVVISTPTEQQPATAGSPIKKYQVALIVLGCVTVLAVVGAFVGVFALNNNAVQKIIKHQHYEEKDSEGNNLKEDVEIDETDNIAKFTVTGEDGDVFHVVQDYNRKLVIMAIPGSEGEDARCMVSVFNTTASASDLTEMQNAASPEDGEKTMYVEDSAPIATPDFLPEAAKSMCRGKDVFWATQQCGDVEENEGGRDKRGLCIRYVRRCYFYRIGWRIYYRCYYYRYLVNC